MTWWKCIKQSGHAIHMVAFWKGIDNKTSWEYHKHIVNRNMLNTFCVSMEVIASAKVSMGVQSKHNPTNRNLFN